MNEAKEKISLGQLLKQAREQKQMSLRTVEQSIGISNAYLSQLENDKIKSPAVNILHKLAGFYMIDFNFLLSAAGIVEHSDPATISMGQYVFSKDNLSTEEENELLQYLKFIRMRDQKKL